MKLPGCFAAQEITGEWNAKRKTEAWIPTEETEEGRPRSFFSTSLLTEEVNGKPKNNDQSVNNL